MSPPTFQVVLPSNASYIEFPNNKNNHYFVRLEKPLDLASGEWEVGLLGIQYPNNWTNVTNGKAFKVYRQASGVRPNQIFNVDVREGRYNTMEELILEIHRTLSSFSFTGEDLHLGSLDRIITLFYDKVKHASYLIIRDYEFSVEFSDEFAEIFGFEKKKVYYQPFNKRKSRKAPNTPDIFKGMTSLYIYTNFVKPYRVGDSMSPLLRTVGVDNTNRYVNIDKEFINVHYHEVESLQSDIVEVDIRRDNGERIPFTGGKTILVVRFRRRSS